MLFAYTHNTHPKTHILQYTPNTHTLFTQERQLEHASHNAAAQEASRALEEAIEQKARLEQRLEEAVNSLTTVKEQHESSQNQLFTMQAEAEQQQAALMHELEVVTVDVEQAQERIRVLEQENAMLLVWFCVV